MDPLTHFLDGPRAVGAFALSMHMNGPWGVSVRDQAALSVLAVTKGQIRVDGTLVEAGDVALVRGPEPYNVTDAAASAPSIEIGPGQQCTTLDGRDLRDDLRHGIRRWGNAADGETSLLIGTYERPDEAGGLVTRALPRITLVPRERSDGPLVSLLARELSHDDPAAQVVVDRLLDVLVVSTIRRWLNSPDRPDKATWLACNDPLVVRALECLHSEPAAPWTVESLARRVNTSRASFAARFRAGVGEPPMTYLTRWRLTLASDLLRAPGATVSQVAHTVGYHNAYAFSTAFKRQVGATPTQYRQRRPTLSTISNPYVEATNPHQITHAEGSLIGRPPLIHAHPQGVFS
ncbi:AraC family transcriptional regulator [Arthrobacter sp. ISL-95]|uniref:AraC family transcriptional regulator n=1 Tax=Arthrobacter sp. ISL-95 TaxID=2819116 RepID=UPI001BEA6157|nr:AraC family transcriptional regulator [Arthrobacter sp. ISL-95]MBT2588574.1 AraC family transcriptional regulator [Arthrobacter sp. ISL-95]